MESFVKSESRNIVGRRKRKLEHEEQGESSSMAGGSSMDEEREMTCTQSKEDSTKRKAFLRSSLSKEWVSTSTSDSEEENEDTDKSYAEGRLTGGEEGNFRASKLQYVDLKNINIFYCDEPQPLEKLMQIVKEDILEKYPDTPDFEKTVRKFTKLTKENLLVSLNLDDFREFRKQTDQAKENLEDFFLQDIISNIKKAKEADRDLDRDLFDRQWLLAVETFLYKTVSLVKRILYPYKDEESIKRAKGSIKRKTKKKTGKDKELDERREPAESVYQTLFVAFGELFFLKPSEVDKRTFVAGNKIVNSTPDLAYSTLARILQTGSYNSRDTILFVVEVKVKQIKNALSNCLEEQVDSGVLGQVGSELFAEAFYSCLFPNSLGIMCMETKIIFVYLKMSKEHVLNITTTKNFIKTEGKIHYTKPYDMLKAEDRAEVCEFLYWLGCFQNHGRWSLMSTERTLL